MMLHSFRPWRLVSKSQICDEIPRRLLSSVLGYLYHRSNGRTTAVTTNTLAA